jgi:hypothetical protein
VGVLSRRRTAARSVDCEAASQQGARVEDDRAIREALQEAHLLFQVAIATFVGEICVAALAVYVLS